MNNYTDNQDIITKTLYNNTEYESCYIESSSLKDNKLNNFIFSGCQIVDNIWDNTFLNSGSFIEGFLKNISTRFSCFNNIKFKNIDFDKVNFDYCIFKDCEFTNTAFENCSCNNIEFINCKFNKNTIIENTPFNNILITESDIPDTVLYKMGEITINESTFNKKIRI